MDLLFGNFIGALSMFVILFMLGMGIFFTWVFVTKSKDENGLKKLPFQCFPACVGLL
ncbi:MAG: DUF3149 domain-containing protein [bacterium]